MQAPKEKRKVGRPIAYCGDPDSPDLTPAERRRIKRRIANRESARRVRARRQEQIEEMAVKVCAGAGVVPLQILVAVCFLWTSSSA